MPLKWTKSMPDSFARSVNQSPDSSLEAVDAGGGEVVQAPSTMAAATPAHLTRNTTLSSHRGRPGSKRSAARDDHDGVLPIDAYFETGVVRLGVTAVVQFVALCHRAVVRGEAG